MKITDIISVKPVAKGIFEKKTGEWSACLVGSGFCVTGKTNDEAVANLLDAIKSQVENTNHIYKHVGGVTFVLYYSHGWCYDIIHPDGGYSSTLLKTKSKYDAMLFMDKHIEQYGKSVCEP